MDRKEHLLVILAEECAELQQAVAKTLRFGLDSEHNGISNLEQIELEFNDIMAVMMMLNKDCIIKADVRMWHQKEKKVEKYLELSKELGTLDE